MFVGATGANLPRPEDLSAWPNPIVFACSNPDPVKPELAHATRNDVIMATGRSDYRNQVNNDARFPLHLPRLPGRHVPPRINEEMKIATALALRDLAKQPVPGTSAPPMAWTSWNSAACIIPKPMDKRHRGSMPWPRLPSRPAALPTAYPKAPSSAPSMDEVFACPPRSKKPALAKFLCLPRARRRRPGAGAEQVSIRRAAVVSSSRLFTRKLRRRRTLTRAGCPRS